MSNEKEKYRVCRFARTVLKPRYEGEEVESIIRSMAAAFCIAYTASCGNWYDEPDGWCFQFIPPREGLYYGMNVTRCGLVNFMQKQDMAELTSLICQGDHQAQPYLPDGVIFKRRQTIAEGSSHCDFRYFEAD